MTYHHKQLPLLVLSAMIISNDEGEILHVRKTGTTSFIMPGGKREPGESPQETARREIAEELGLDTAGEALDFVGTFYEKAANEANTAVVCDVFRLCRSHTELPEPQAEIAEVRFLSPDSSLSTIAPLSRRVFAHLRDSITGNH
ncbi:hypothetical protein CAQU_04645 [Corynebacterium aquilae DSM 44791]|uniref:Nudix hydrolase domain-containing protein n=1 Tax=Corynebacterium aquilae DSM 44791 TaxID=1431546 RepID=A0A1L7CIZ6_9CORY|nr:hypothetical protein CAQU_04645 [Corynebacterium aquilae DSM 44791]